jgi:predicted nuclease with TOPRIM domain
MPDISLIAAGIQSVKTALDITKELRNIDSSFKDAEVKLKIAQLIEALSEAKIQLTEAREENHDLKAKIKELEDQINKQDEVEFSDGFYFLKEPTAGMAKGPFCAKCYSDEGKLILVTELPDDFQDFGRYKWPKCGDIGGK